MSFGIYLLVSVVVLINLLIAMMSDTYQRIQAQSDIEWKYGLCKLIRNMHRTSTAPSPLNLLTTWLFYVIELCKSAKVKKRKRPDMIRMLHTFQSKQMSPRTKAAMKWLSKIRKDRMDSLTFDVVSDMVPGTPADSHKDFAVEAARIEHITDWEVVATKYRVFMGYQEEVKEIEDGEGV